jgi:hypothetical protein
MSRIGRYMAAAVVLALGGIAAAADDRGIGTSGLPGRSPSTPVGTSSPGAAGIGAADALGSNCAHEMTGTVKRLNAAEGTVSVDVAGSDLVLRLPPNELSGFKEGDQIVVSVGVREVGEGQTPAEHDLDPSRGIGRATP